MRVTSMQEKKKSIQNPISTRLPNVEQYVSSFPIVEVRPPVNSGTYIGRDDEDGIGRR